MPENILKTIYDTKMETLDKQVDNKPLRDELGRLLPGNTANPNGRPKGLSLKEFWRQRLALMTDEEKLAFSSEITKDMVWKMGEGMPKQDIEGNIEVKSKIVKLDE